MGTLGENISSSWHRSTNVIGDSWQRIEMIKEPYSTWKLKKRIVVVY